MGSDPEVQPLVSVLPPVPEQWAAWPMKVSEPWVKMKWAVHWAAAVKVCTPGWMGADAAGAPASAAEAGMTKEANAARHNAAAATRGNRLTMGHVAPSSPATHASLR